MPIETLKAEANEIGQSLLEPIADLPRAQEDEIAVSDMAEMFAADLNNARQFAAFEAFIELADDTPVSPRQAADRIMDVLRDDGWSGGERETNLGYFFRKTTATGDWSVSVSATTREPPYAQSLHLFVQSPLTDPPK